MKQLRSVSSLHVVDVNTVFAVCSVSITKFDLFSFLTVLLPLVAPHCLLLAIQSICNFLKINPETTHTMMLEGHAPLDSATTVKALVERSFVRTWHHDVPSFTVVHPNLFDWNPLISTRVHVCCRCTTTSTNLQVYVVC